MSLEAKTAVVEIFSLDQPPSLISNCVTPSRDRVAMDHIVEP